MARAAVIEDVEKKMKAAAEAQGARQAAAEAAAAAAEEAEEAEAEEAEAADTGAAPPLEDEDEQAAAAAAGSSRQQQQQQVAAIITMATAQVCRGCSWFVLGVWCGVLLLHTINALAHAGRCCWGTARCSTAHSGSHTGRCQQAQWRQRQRWRAL